MSAPAAAPTAWWDDADFAPGVMDGEYAGHLGAGGIAAAALLLLILGTREKAKHKMRPMTALLWGFVASTIWLGAGGIWAVPSDLLRHALTQAGIGTGEGTLGDIGMGAAALSVLAIVYFVDLKPRAEAWWGIVMAIVFAGAGGFWGMPVMIVADFTSGLT